MLLTRDGRMLYVICHRPPAVRAVRLQPIDRRPTEVVLLNTGQPLDARVDLIPSDMNAPALRIRDLPEATLTSDVAVIRCEFENPLPEHIEPSAGASEQN